MWRDLGALQPEKVRLEFKAVTRRLGLKEATAPKLLRHQFATSLQDANVDPLIRNELMGHAPSGLGMTATYTHTRPETRRKQLELALVARPAVAVAWDWLQGRQPAKRDGEELLN